MKLHKLDSKSVLKYVLIDNVDRYWASINLKYWLLLGEDPFREWRDTVFTPVQVPNGLAKNAWRFLSPLEKNRAWGDGWRIFSL